MNKSKTERHGEIMILSQVALYGLFPVVINYGTRVIQPLLFLALSALASAIFFFLYLLISGRFNQIFNKKALPYIIGVVIFIVTVPNILLFLGTKLTSGTNTAILLQLEVFFAFIICSLFFNEKITRVRLLGSAIIVIGACLILYNGNFQLNIGDLLIVIGAALFPIGNIFSKKALDYIPSDVTLFLRNILGGVILLAISLIFEKSSPDIIPAFQNFWTLILLNGLLLFGLAKILWYEGLKRIDITKATAIGSAFPAFSLIFAMIFLNERPAIYQIAGFLAIFIGVLLIIRKDSLKENPVEI